MSVAMSQTVVDVDRRSAPTLLALDSASVVRPPSNRTTMVLHVTMPGLLEALSALAQPEGAKRPIVLVSRKGPIIRASSRSARNHGVRRGMSLTRAKRRCPALEVFYADLDARRRGIERWLDPIATFSPAVGRVERDSIALSIRVIGGAMAQRVALRLRSALDALFPGDARIGIGPNDIVARGAAASALGPEIVSLRESTYRDWVNDRPVGALPGISDLTAARLAALGVHSGGQLARASIATLTDHFGCKADVLVGIARGEHRVGLGDGVDAAADDPPARRSAPRMELVT